MERPDPDLVAAPWNATCEALASGGMAASSKTLVTGSTGFIGSHLTRALAARGDTLRLLIRRDTPHLQLDGIEFERINGDINDRRAVRRALEGVGRVFHVAGTTSMRSADAERVFEVNVGGTALLAEEARAAGVERFVHTSSGGAVGAAVRGGRIDEAERWRPGGYGIPYIDSKHEAETEILRQAAHGLDAVIVNPTFVLGPGATRPTGSTALVTRFLARRIPAYVDGGLNIVDVRDVVTGHLQAEAKGERGERYILGGRNFTMQRLFADLSRISGVPAPEARLPAGLAVNGAKAAEVIGIPVGFAPDEARSASMWWTFSSAKAKRELGFNARPHEETLEDAIETGWGMISGFQAPAPRDPTRQRVTDLALRGATQAARIVARTWPG